MNNYKSFSKLKEELGDNYDFKLYEMGISALKEIENLQQENKQLKEQLLVAQTNEETFRLEMEDITKILGLDENMLFDDVKVYARSLKDNWNKLKEYIRKNIIYDDVGMKILDPSPLEDYMQEIEQGSDSK